MSYGCGKCLKQAFISSSTLHNHKKVCIGFITKKSPAGSDSKPSSGEGGDGSHGDSTRATPKKRDSKAPTVDSQGSSTQPTSQHHATVDERRPTTTSPTRIQRTCQAKEEGCKPCQAGLQPQGAQGQWLTLGWGPPKCHHFKSVPQLSQ